VTIQFVGKRRRRRREVEIRDFMGNNDFPFAAAGAFLSVFQNLGCENVRELRYETEKLGKV
jgi:hypothetical protein